MNLIRYNVFKCPKTSGACELLGSFDNEDDAKMCKAERNKENDDDHSIILIHKLEYEV